MMSSDSTAHWKFPTIASGPEFAVLTDCSGPFPPCWHPAGQCPVAMRSAGQGRRRAEGA